jgi:hypothetical protein
MKRIVKHFGLVLLLSVVGLGFYIWGHLDGREGRSSGLIRESIAAESPSKSSPLKAREGARS